MFHFKKIKRNGFLLFHLSTYRYYSETLCGNLSLPRTWKSRIWACPFYFGQERLTFCCPGPLLAYFSQWFTFKITSLASFSSGNLSLKLVICPARKCICPRQLVGTFLNPHSIITFFLHWSGTWLITLSSLLLSTKFVLSASCIPVVSLQGSARQTAAWGSQIRISNIE